jgi:hypothetical protein
MGVHKIGGGSHYALDGAFERTIPKALMALYRVGKRTA